MVLKLLEMKRNLLFFYSLSHQTLTFLLLCMGSSVVIVDFCEFIVSLTSLMENLVKAIKGEKINENI